MKLCTTEEIYYLYVSLVQGNDILFIKRSEEQDEQILYGLASSKNTVNTVQFVDEFTWKAAADVLVNII